MYKKSIRIRLYGLKNLYFCILGEGILQFSTLQFSLNTMKRTFWLLVSMYLCSVSLIAQTTSGSDTITAITTAVPFLTICPDAKSGALSEAGVAIADNANAIYWNPSILAFSQKKAGFAVNYTPWLRALNIPDINHGFIPGYLNLGEKGGVIGAAITYFSLGEIQFTNEQGQNIGSFNANEFAFSLAYSHKITEHLAAGTALRYIRSNLAGSMVTSMGSLQPAQSIAGDMNVFYTKDFQIKSGGKALPMNFRFGMNISNIGAKVTYSNTARKDFIPTNLKIGYALKANIDEYNAFTFTNDFNKLLVPSAGGQTQVPLMTGIFSSFSDRKFSEEVSEINVSLGAEYMYNNLFAVRAGYFYEDPLKGGRKFITLGAGLKFRVFTLDFAYLASLLQNHPLQNTLRFSLAFDFE